MVSAALHRRAPRGAHLVDALVVGAGKVIGYMTLGSRLLPGLGGAALVSAATGEIASHVFGHGLAPWVGGLVGGMFLLQIDRKSGLQPPDGR